MSDRAGQARRRISTQAFLAALVLVLVGPGLVFTGLLLTRYADAKRESYAQEARNIARQTANAIDRDLTGLLNTLQAISTSSLLIQGDIPAFYNQVSTVRSFINADIGLRLPDGQMLVNTRLPLGAGLSRSVLPIDQRVIDTGLPVVSDSFVGSLSKRPLFAIVMAVPPNAMPSYLLHVSAPTERIAATVRQGLPRGWVIGVGDNAGNYIARSDRHEEFSGKPGLPAFLRQMVGPEGSFVGENPFGAPILVGYARSAVAGWTVAASISQDVIEQPLRRDLFLLVVFGAGVLALSALLAYWLWGAIARPLRALAAAGPAIGTGGASLEITSPVREVAELADVIRAASDDLVERSLQRDRHEAELRASEARLRAIIDTVPVGILIAETPSGRLIEGNRQVEEITGHPNLASAGVEDYGEWHAIHPDGRPVAVEEFPLSRVVRDGLPRAEMECLYRRGDGREIWIRLIAAPIATGGAVVTILDTDKAKRAEQELEWRVAERTRELGEANRALVTEMTRREAAESQLRQVQKMEAIGQLTGGIAHDFNNMLAVIIGGLDLTRRRLGRGDTDVAKFVDAAMDGARRAAVLTGRLLAFSRQQPLAPEATDANRLVGGMSELLHRSIGEAIRMETVLAAGLWRIHVDVAQLENVLLNLAVNARDAMPDGGRLTIETANCLLDEDYARAHPGVVPGQYVMIAVTDTGVGMSEDVAARAFEPFFTTKPVGQGTGLGLSQVYGFVRQTGGHVKIYAEPGHGTTIKVYLPRFYGAGEAAPAADTAAVAAGPGAGEVILVVEDDERVRQVSVATLTDLGYTVLSAPGGADGLRLLDSRPDIALLFTDIVMPDMNGRRLADEALRRRPDLKVLYTTGFTRNAVVHNGVLDPGVSFLPKPFTVDQLATRIRELLDTR